MTFPSRKATTHFVYNQGGGVRVRYVYFDPPKCVKCGNPVTDQDMQSAARRWLAPCCAACEGHVFIEQSQGIAMWPDGYFGHWAKDSSGDTWTQI